MLVTFYCHAYANITMFGKIAQRLLVMMGQSGQVPGAILSEDVVVALVSLEQALKKESNNPTSKHAKQDDEEDEVSLAHRAVPLIELLKAAIDAGCDVMWKSNT